ncbi:hypothetical protein A2617_01115 [Candidatus Daviesbacteria bacterium RIFOXYD1_FULL_41_10]|uniref:Putative pre-16S rRNA nuclease n=3 Tax=Microgenomates group TaxID=1794810 RepID=A0A0G0L304_9BACT|nr:MAG: Holliday junction resolvase YqgF [Microgenomates group bacterium GW2011_GWC1_37_12b]KKQ43951.1 MAG: Holliday junction resolvase YqgF [Candidatus Woesebacteria bacterium GW2011_GWA1_37_8]KKQ86353.1 MAG: Holliday junction resolvase YqgF [Candidatus Woesebacteria bacterium GW2011_GWB1_38_8b]OGE71030.1 MAG: hypothetical protein A2617_01115 [Candidatus Daviesbacteria bacterium RIFOXYD1_FULL_41_10]
MDIIGIDFGRKKIGVALGNSESRFAEPLQVVRYQSLEEGLEKINDVVKKIRAGKVVVGVSEGTSKKEAIEFGNQLESKFGIEVVFQDETLTTQDAQRKSIEAGIKRKTRRDMEDAYAATLILQEYLDNLQQI